jgi:predicted anti-sigma-YlaC factor YlaD
MTKTWKSTRTLMLTLWICASTTGCIKQAAVNALADQLSSSTSSSFASDDDLLLIGDAVPFALKLMESTAESAPNHVGIHTGLASGFTQYAQVFVMHPAMKASANDPAILANAEIRAAKLFGRAKQYGMAALEIDYPGMTAALTSGDTTVLATMGTDDLPQLYWTATPWLGQISLSKSDMALIGDLPTAIALLDRALEIDHTYDRGGIHDLLVSIESSRPMPGAEARARAHFEAAVSLCEGERASPYVGLAMAVSMPNQNKTEFISLLNQALEIDPDSVPAERLANVYYQEQALLLLSQVDDFFL